MIRPFRRTLGPATFLAALFAGGAALAQEGPAHGQESVEEISRRISKALRENEEALSRLARGDLGAPRQVDIEVPEEEKATPAAGATKGAEPAEKGREVAKGIEELLEGSRDQGRSIVDGIEEILRQAASRARQVGAGPPSEGRSGASGEPDGSRNTKKEQEEEKDPLQDPGKKEEGGDRPEDGRDSKRKPPPDSQPPRSEKEKTPPRDMKGVFLARLPDKVKESVLNGDFDQVPEKYRDLIREWTRLLGEEETKE